MIDGTLIPIDRVAADKPFYSGKHKKHGLNLQVIASPDGDILWVSGALPGSVHDKKAEWIRGVLAELEAAGLIVLADKGYQGSAYAKVPYKGKNKPASQKEANKAHAKLRSPGERANAQLKTWRILRKLRCCPWRVGQLAKAIHVCRSARQTQDEKGSLFGHVCADLAFSDRSSLPGFGTYTAARLTRAQAMLTAHWPHRAFTRNFSASAPVASRWPREYRPRGESSPQARY